MPGSDDRRLRPAAAGASTTPSLASRPASPGEPVEGAPGWRVTRRSAPPVGTGSVPRAPRAMAAEADFSVLPELMPGESGALARPPRRVAGVAPRGRGISLLALAAAAVVVVCALGLAALDLQGLEWPPSWSERPAMYGNPGQASIGRPG